MSGGNSIWLLTSCTLLCFACTGSPGPIDGGQSLDAGLGDAGASDGGPSDAGGHDAGPQVEEGTVDGVPFTVQDSSWYLENGSGFDFRGPGLYVSVSAYSGNCAAWTAGASPLNGQDIVLALAVTDDGGRATPPTLAGQFEVAALGNGGRQPNASLAEVYYEAGCENSNPYAAVQGSVTLSLVTAQEVRGEYDLTLSCADFECATATLAHITGTFDAQECAQMNVNRSFLCTDGG